MSRAAAGSETRTARAKVNLCLHVVGCRADGYHLLESLVVFPEIGDRLSVEPSAHLSLAIDGPFGPFLSAAGDNLVLRAAEALRSRGGVTRGAALHLEKVLPIGSGIGGGSSDAAAALRLLNAHWGLDLPRIALREIGASLGADVPACLSDDAVWMAGVGERLSPSPAAPGFWMTLVNPGRAVSTPAVFGALREKINPAPPPRPLRFQTLDALIDWLAATRNDLEPPAERLAPEIAELRAVLAETSGCRLARMSGSGATCFGIFAKEAEALAAADRLRLARPGWWSVAARVTETALS